MIGNNNMKKFAFYLPQFHTIPENNEWWGEGFTEWTNVKKAKPLFGSHKQPIHPLNDNYYNLLDKSVVEWQTDLMKNYKVDGLIYYHYYFCGKKLLEKPAENLLNWKDINQPFFFCWANHSWSRSWEGKTELLISQTYGDENDWLIHFEYLLPFFKDSRYLKIDNKPVIMIYDSSFRERDSMFDLFNEESIKNGFDGIYVIETFKGGQNINVELQRFKESASKQTKKIFIREHLVSANVYRNCRKYIPYRILNKVKKCFHKIFLKENLNALFASADSLYKVIRQDEPHSDDYVHGLFFEWDNTPRHHDRGTIVTAPSKKAFFKIMDYLKNDDFVFINAWNEWCEGMMLEPTKENGYKYLEWIKEWSEKNG